MFYHDKTRDVLVYPQSPLLIQALDEAKSVNGTYLAVPRNLRNLQILRHYNHPVPPIMTEYDWPLKPGWKPLPHQKLMANFMVLHRRCFNLSDMGCVDCETEYLSPTGWKRIDQYDGGEVAQYHSYDGHVDFVHPTEYVTYPCSGMLRFKTTRGIDQKLSHEHRVVYVDYRGSICVDSAASVARKQEQQRQGWRGRIITTFKGGQDGIDLSEPQLRLMVAVIADGHFPGKNNYCTISVKKDRKKVRLRWLLRSLKLEFREKDLPYEGKEGYTLFAFHAPRREKEFTAYYWKASHQQLRVVAEECAHWDGSAPIGNRGPRFSSTIKASADFIQYAFAATGKTALLSAGTNKFVNLIYNVNAQSVAKLLAINGSRDDGSKTTPITIEPTTDGKKYCFEVPTNMLVMRRNGCIFITGNTMKTMSTLWAADWLMRQHPPGTFRCLIVAPLSTLQRVWGDAIFANFLGKRTFEVLHGSAEQRLEALNRAADFYIINFDGVGVGAHTRKRFELDGFSKSLAARSDIRLAVIDEASAYKVATTKRHRISRLVFGAKDYLWLLSGTPTAHAPTDAYGLAKLVNNAYGKSFTTFQAESMIKVSDFKWVPQKDGYEKAGRLLQPAIRFALKDVWDGPEMTVQQRQVNLTEQQTKLLADLKRNLQITLKSGKEITAMNEAAARQKVLQIILGEVYDESHKAHAVDAGPRISELKDLIEEAPGKILVFVELTSVVSMLYKELRKVASTEMVYGGTSEHDRSRIFQAFQSDGGPRVLVAHPGTMAHGLDLWKAQTVIWYGPTDKTEVYLQANRRAYRPGQKYPVTIVQIVATKLEQEIFRRLEGNESMQGALLELIRKGEL